MRGDGPEQVVKTIFSLSSAIDSLHLPTGVEDIVNQDQLDRVCCSSLNLEAATMNCLSVAIKYSQGGYKSLFSLFNCSDNNRTENCDLGND